MPKAKRTPYIRTTDEHNRELFRPHGRVTFIQQENIVVCLASGPFNKELIEAVKIVREDFISHLDIQGPFGNLLVIEDSALASIQTLEIFRDYLKQMIVAGSKAAVSALSIARTVDGRNIMVHHITNAYKEAGMDISLFDDFDSAKLWITKKLKHFSQKGVL